MLPTLIIDRFELFLLIRSSSASQISYESLSSQLNLSERQPSTMIKKIWRQEASTLLGERLGLTHERPNYHFIGTDYSLRSVSKWRSTNSSGLWYPQRSLLSALTNQLCRNLTMGRDTWKARKSSYTTMQQARVQCYCLMQPLQGKKPFHY